MLDIYKNILQAIESKEKTSCLDLQKLLTLLILKYVWENWSICIKRLPFIWFRSYLSNRKQAVKIGQRISNFRTINCGVLQGSVLGLLLFLMYVNDIHVSSLQVKIHLSACETCIFYSSKQL